MNRYPAYSNADTPHRVLHVINGQHYAGAERVQDLLGLQLPTFGFEVSFACVKPGEFAAMREARECRLYDLPMRARVDLRPALALARIVKNTNAVLLHAHTPRSLLVARLAAMMARIPVVYHVHSPTARDSNRPLNNWINNTTERFSLAGVSHLITVSRSLAAHMEAEGVQPNLITTIPNGVPSRGPLGERPERRSPWTIGTVALFRPRKGLETLLHALAQLRHQDMPVRLRAVGGFETPEYERDIDGLTRQLGVSHLIDWVGFTRDVHSQLERVDLFVLPSLYGEGLPMVVLEAMAAGVPVVATRVEGIPEAIRDGVDGLLADPGNARDLARAVRTAIECPKTLGTLRRNAHQRHAEHFSDCRMAERVADVYRAILKVEKAEVSA
ncbi:MAG: glycosyltransferase [Planctomycetota bacterium]